MKILVVCQYYYPEPFRITNICEELVQRGHEVTVITGLPNYPMGNIYPGYEGNARQDEVIHGVHVHRCSIHPRKTGIVHRLWNYYSFSWASKRYIKQLDDSFDVVFINQLSPVMMAKAGIKYAKKHGKKSVLYCLDLWPASLQAGGISGGVVYKWFYRESKKVYRAVDKILTSSQSFKEYFESQFGITEVEYLPQHAEDTFSPLDCKKEADEFFDLMFAGNIGSAQSVDTIIKAAALCRDIPNLRWHIVGDGKELDHCRRLAQSIEAPVIFYGRKSIDEMPAYYSMADAMLVTMQKDSIGTMTLPGKVQSYMAAGKPIVGAVDGETADIIAQSRGGVCVPAENAEALSQCVRTIIADRGSLKEYADHAIAYYKCNFDKKQVITRLEAFLRENITD